MDHMHLNWKIDLDQTWIYLNMHDYVSNGFLIIPEERLIDGQSLKIG